MTRVVQAFRMRSAKLHVKHQDFLLTIFLCVTKNVGISEQGEFLPA